jgi:septum formation protein
VEKTKVFFRRFSLKELADYAATREPYDKAGGYDIQGTAASWVKSWEGDYYNVMGLPLLWLTDRLTRFGLNGPGRKLKKTVAGS